MGKADVVGPEALFWFIISPLFTAPADACDGQHVATYLLRPELVLDRLWALPDLTLHTLRDAENSLKYGSDLLH